MKSQRIFGIVILLAALTGCNPENAGTPEPAPQTLRPVREVVLTGDGYERGLQHGRELKKEVAQIVEAWKANASNALGRDADSILTDFFEYADFEDAIQKWTPGLYEEVRGIAEGAGVPFREVLVLNLLDEFWVFIDNLENHHCSGMGIPASAESPSIVAQNMDLENYTDGFQVLFRIPRQGDAPEQLILSHAGLIGLNGLNETGVGVCVNTLMQLRASEWGLPVAFVVRSLISRTDKDDLLDFLQSVDHASGQNYIIGVGGEVFDFEASAGKVVRFTPDNPLKAVYHTNHPLANDDIKSWHADWASKNANSSARFNAVEVRAKNPSGSPTELIADALRSKDDATYPVCRPNQSNGRGFTFASVIMELSENPTLKVTFGPPDESEYRTFRFTAAP